MKTTLSFLFVFALNISFSQVSIYKWGEATLLNGQVDTCHCEGDETHCDYQVNNNTGGDMVMNVRRVILNYVGGSQDQLCWGVCGGIGTCYGFTQFGGIMDTLTTNDPDIPADTCGVISSYHKANGNAGTGVYRYYVLDDVGATIDSFDVVYNCQSLDAEESDLDRIKVISMDTEKGIRVISPLNGIMKLYELSGKKIYETSVESGMTEFLINGIDSGLYLYSIQSSEGRKTGRVVLR